MARVRIVEPPQRLDRLEFSGEGEWRDHAVQLGAYTCPHCGHHVGLRSADLRRHEPAPSANLESLWRERFDVARPDARSAGESHLDFHCPGCHAPVRLAYAPGPEYAMGAHPWRFTAVFEAARWPDEAREGDR